MHELVSPHGMITESMFPQTKPNLATTSSCELVAIGNQKALYVGCWHLGARNYFVNLFGEMSEFHEGGLVNLAECPACFCAKLAAAVARCARCGRGIKPGESVAFYAQNRKLRPEAIRFRQAVIGCVRPDCCPDRKFIGGFWNGQQVVPMFGNGMTAGDVLLLPQEA